MRPWSKIDDTNKWFWMVYVFALNLIDLEIAPEDENQQHQDLAAWYRKWTP